MQNGFLSFFTNLFGPLVAFFKNLFRISNDGRN